MWLKNMREAFRLKYGVIKQVLRSTKKRWPRGTRRFHADQNKKNSVRAAYIPGKLSFRRSPLHAAVAGQRLGTPRGYGLRLMDAQPAEESS